MLLGFGDTKEINEQEMALMGHRWHEAAKESVAKLRWLEVGLGV